METDLNKSPDSSISAPKKGPNEILKSEIEEGMVAFNRPSLSLFMSALSAGLDVGFSILLMAVMWTQTHGQLSDAVSSILVGCMYSVGFIFVVQGRSELFTEQTSLAVLPVLSGQAKLKSLLRLWAIVYAANLLGAVIIAWFIAWIAPAMNVASTRAFERIARKMIDHPAHVIFCSAILAGWLMGLLSWLVAAGRDTISQIVLVFLVTSCIGFVGLHHVVLGSVEVLAGMFATHSFSLSVFSRVVFWATMGNIIGGSIFVSLIKYGHAHPHKPSAQQDQQQGERTES